MKALDIAFKDTLRAFRSGFLLVMMFVAPLLITGLIYFAFGSLTASGGFDLPVTRVAVANLDQPDPASTFAVGQMLADHLQDESLADLLQVTIAPGAASARAAVDRQEADVALIVPPDFTVAVLGPDLRAALTLYYDPALTIKPAILRTLLGGFIDGFSGAKIAVGVTALQLEARGLSIDEATGWSVAQGYTEWLQASGADHVHLAGGAMETQAPSRDAPQADSRRGMIGSVMAGMLVFFVFFTGAGSASSIIHEDEQGTLARLLTTPTSRAVILGGKFAASLFTLVVQALVLLIASTLVFDIHWGEPLTVTLVTIGLVVVAAGFGVLLMSFVKTTRQAGPIQGGVLTVMGLLGGLFTGFIPDLPKAFDTLSLTMPQGWAMRGWQIALSSASAAETLLPVAVMLVLGTAFFAVGVLVFRRRFA